MAEKNYLITPQTLRITDPNALLKYEIEIMQNNTNRKRKVSSEAIHNELSDIIKSRLKEYKITEQQYHGEYSIFEKLGFNKEQINKLILHERLEGRVKAVISLDEIFNHQQIVDIADYYHGDRNLAAINKNYLVLKKLRLCDDDIIRLAAHNGGDKNLAAVIKYHSALKDLGFSDKDIICIAAYDYGYKNLTAVIKNHQALKGLGFTTGKIVHLAAHTGGFQNLEAVTENQQILLSLKYGVDQIIRLLERNVDAKRLAKELKLALEAKENAIKCEQNNGSGIIECPKSKEPVLEKRAVSFSEDVEYREIPEFTGKERQARKLRVLLSHFEEKLKRGTKNQTQEEFDDLWDRTFKRVGKKRIEDAQKKRDQRETTLWRCK